MNERLVESLRRAVDAAPSDIPLRLLLGRLLLDGGVREEAIAVAVAALQLDSTNEDSRSLMNEALRLEPNAASASVVVSATEDVGTAPIIHSEPPQFDWSAAEEQVEDIAKPMFTDVGDSAYSAHDRAFRIEQSRLSLDDVGGMNAVKARLNAAFLAPLKNPELRKLYGKSLRGGLLMYGPPGCGKTYIAKAIAGELGASFLAVSLADVLDPMMGVSEQNIHSAFETARRSAPCVLFLDEVDSLGQRRSMTRNTGMRGVANQLLTELDGVSETNDGVFVLAATNQPWDIDPAFRRPGRFDRTVLVLPPDDGARLAIFRNHLAHRPVEGIDLARLAASSKDLTGADIAYVCEAAAERALMDSVTSGVARMIGMLDLLETLAEMKPSSRSWLASARNVVMFGDDDGTYEELRTYLKSVKR